MKIIMIDQNENNIHILKTDHINFINFQSGKLILPTVNGLNQLQICFLEEGDFWIESDKIIKLGCMEGKKIVLHPGKFGCDTQPKFVYTPSQQSWMMISQGNAIYPDKNETWSKEYFYEKHKRKKD